MSDLKTRRTTVRRSPRRGAYDFDTIARILDEGLYCHIGFVAGSQPYAVPTIYGREDRTLYVHGSSASRMLKSLSGSIPVCLTVTLLDGLVLARSAFHHSMNYRSVMVLASARKVRRDEKLHGLEVITEHLVRGRWADARPPTERELKATAVLKLEIEEASAKVRQGPPLDDEEDLSLPVWAGQLPLSLVPGTPVPDPELPPDVKLPGYLAGYRRP